MNVCKLLLQANLHALPRAMPFATACFLFLFLCGWGTKEYANRPRGSSPRSAKLSNKLAAGHTISQVAAFERHTTEVRQKDLRHWTTELSTSGGRPSDLLVLVLTANEASWGRNKGDMYSRTINSFVQLMAQTQYPFEHTSVGLLTSSEAHFNEITTVFEAEMFRKSHVIYYAENGTSTGRKERHVEGIQLERRRSIARLRNYLMLRTLDNEKHIVWLDADVYWLSPGIIQNMIQQSLTASTYSHEAKIITARCTLGKDASYDRNAWTGPRTVPTEVQDQQKVGTFFPQPTADTQFMDQLVQGTTDDDLIPLDSVGGTILFLSSDIILQGVIFPT